MQCCLHWRKRFVCDSRHDLQQISSSIWAHVTVTKLRRSWKRFLAQMPHDCTAKKREDNGHLRDGAPSFENARNRVMSLTWCRPAWRASGPGRKTCGRTWWRRGGGGNGDSTAAAGAAIPPPPCAPSETSPCAACSYADRPPLPTCSHWNRKISSI